MTIMTPATTAPGTVKHPDPAGPRMFPDTMGGFPPCEVCFTRKPDQADTVRDGRIQTLCRDCASGRPVIALVGDALAAQWERIAHWAINGEVTDALVGRALEALAGHLGEQARNAAFEELCEALLWSQEVESPGFEMASVEPEERDEDRLITNARARVADALAELVGGAR